jgi:hypothetical protein
MKGVRSFFFTTAVAAALLQSASAAYADNITTFAVATNFSSPVGAASGTIAIDTTSGVVDSIDMSFAGQPGSVFPIGTNWDVFGAAPNQLVEISEQWDNLANDDFYSVDIVLPVDTLAGYAGGNICSATDPCYGGATSGFAYGIVASKPYTNGQLVPVPEPTTWLLLGSGAVCSVWRFRRKLHRRSASVWKC